MRKHIPNILTCMNVFSGSVACIMAFQGNYLWVVIWIIIAAVCDFFDGFSARMLKAYSPIGKDLDSLADMVSFGLAPSILVFRFLSDSYTIRSIDSPLAEYIPYISFMLTIFSALRLAKFNIDTRQTTSFIGLNTPANALFWISLCYGLNSNRTDITDPAGIYIVIALVIVFSLLLIAEIPMFSLKIKSLKLKGNEFRYILIVFISIAIFLWGVLGITTGIVLYIALSILSNLFQKKDLQEKEIR